MTRRCVLTVILLSAVLGTVLGQQSFLDVIDIDNLPEARTFRDEAAWYREHRYQLGRLGVDESAAQTEAELKARLTRLLGLTQAQVTTHQRNPDLLLFRVLLYWDFHSINWIDYSAEIPAELLRIESLFPYDYRAFWFLGSFYASAVKPLASIKQYSYIIDTLSPDAPPPMFWRSYASTAAFADMHKHALEACRTCAFLDPDYIIEDDIVYKISNRFHTPSFDTVIKPGTLYQFQVREEGFGILCRLFGVYIPVDKTWGTRSSEVKENASFLVFTPSPVSVGGHAEAVFTIILEFTANHRAGFQMYQDGHLKKYKLHRQTDESFGEYPFLVYEVFDPDRRKSLGGLHGYQLFLNRPEPSVKGLAIERPVASLFDEKTGEPHYRPPYSFDRYDGEIYYSLTMDCGEDIFTQAAEVFRAFVRGLLFD